MSRDRRQHRHSNNGNWKNNNSQENNYRGDNNSRNEYHARQDNRSDSFAKKEFRPQHNHQPTYEQLKAENEAIDAFKKANQCNCPKCNQPVTELSSAITDKATGKPMHFDCALESVQSQEQLASGDKVIYIGQGRFGVVNFPNIHDTKHFTIKKIIDFEEKEKRSPWRDEMSDLYSQVR